VAELLCCLDTSVLIKSLVVEEPREQAAAAADLLLRCLSEGRLVAPAWAWAEVGSVLRKKLRQGLLTAREAGSLWSSFCELPIEFLDSPAMRRRAWELAERYDLPTLYDAAFLACTELASALPEAGREYWTADDELLRRMEPQRPAYVRRIGERP
jgi:predicted nucleic acid-binding protein